MRACGEALTHAPDDPDLHLLLARIQLDGDDPTTAIGTAERALTLGGSTDALHVLAIALRQAGDPTAALEVLDRAIDQEPSWLVLHVTRGVTLLRRVELRRDPPDTAATRDDGHATDDASAADIDAARRSAAHAATSDPLDERPHYVLGYAAALAGDLPVAASHFDDALERHPVWPAAHLALAQVRAMQGMSRMASEHYVRAGALAPAEPDARDGLRRLTADRRGRLRRLLRRRAPRVRVVPEAARILAIDHDLRGRDEEVARRAR